MVYSVSIDAHEYAVIAPCYLSQIRSKLHVPDFLFFLFFLLLLFASSLEKAVWVQELGEHGGLVEVAALHIQL